ncbi:MAG TPA: HEAT repeat domain-containing protein [Planctomycetota bacterium]|nr:HEAT repeat domain-containing protein [Planctomycetota bacterium]
MPPAPTAIPNPLFSPEGAYYDSPGQRPGNRRHPIPIAGLLRSPEGAYYDSPGQRPGNRRPTHPLALKGRHILLALLAATAFGGALEPKQAFEQLRSYDYGHDISPLVAIEALIDQSSNDAPQRKQITAQLVAILQEPKTPNAAKQFICRQLERIGTDEHVPLLAKMLADPQTGEFARRALQQIPGDAAAAALRDALAKAQGNLRIGLINSLGERCDPKAVEPLARLIADPDAKVAKAAIRSLGKIGTSEAAAALARGRDAPPTGEIAEALCHAQLRCADALATAGDDKSADAIYLPIYLRALGQKQPVILRIAALAGLVKTRKDKAAPFIIESLGDADPQLRGVAAQLARQPISRDFTRALAEHLQKADPGGQVLILGVLAERGDKAVLGSVTRLTESPDEKVKVAAIGALARLGDRSTIEFLARLAAASQGAVQQAARESMARLREANMGAEMMAALSAAVNKGETRLAVELIEALVSRGSREAVPMLDDLAKKGEGEIRLAALKALGVLAEAKQFPLLIAQVLAARAEPEAKAAEEAALKVAGRIAVQADRVRPVLEALRKAPSGRVPALLRLMGRNPGPEALAAIRKLASDPNEAARDAAIRALAEWPTDEVADDLLKLAKGAENPTHRVLTLRGYLRVARTTKRLEQAVPLVKANEEKLALLAALSEAGDAAALKLAAGYLDDPAVRAEAILACLKLGDAVVGTDKEAVKAAMQKVLDAKPEKALAARAQALFEGRRGFVPLFDGKSLNGWTSNGVGKWSVEEGAIVGNGTQKPGYGMLFSEKQYKDFTLRFRYKVLAGNAGFYIRAEKLNTANGVRGLQVEIDPAKDNGGLFEVGGRDWVAKPDAKLPKDYFKPRDWNDVTVVAQGRHLTVTMNGHKTVELPNDPGRTEGFFALGMHGGGVHVMFKDIEVLAAQ